MKAAGPSVFLPQHDGSHIVIDISSVLGHRCPPPPLQPIVPDYSDFTAVVFVSTQLEPSALQLGGGGMQIRLVRGCHPS